MQEVKERIKERHTKKKKGKSITKEQCDIDNVTMDILEHLLKNYIQENIENDEENVMREGAKYVKCRKGYKEDIRVESVSNESSNDEELLVLHETINTV